MIVVFDASTIIGAALKPNSIPLTALQIVRQRHTIALSSPVWAEIADVLARPKFARPLTENRRLEISVLIAGAAIWADPTETVSDCRDDKDNKYLELALAAGAQCIVSSDEDLLVLNPWHGAHILRPREFLTIT